MSDRFRIMAESLESLGSGEGSFHGGGGRGDDITTSEFRGSA